VSGLRQLTAREASPRLAARRFAVESLAPYLCAAPGDLELVKEGRVPRLRLRGGPAGVDVSLSHHGRFVAFACALARQDTRPQPVATNGSDSWRGLLA
jgi:hypothetical protein